MLERTVIHGANFGRDAYTIATMGDAIASAFQGIGGIRADWIEKVQRVTTVIQEEMAERLVIRRRLSTNRKNRRARPRQPQYLSPNISNGYIPAHGFSHFFHYGSYMLCCHALAYPSLPCSRSGNDKKGYEMDGDDC
jgi:hypothetical protein